MDDVIPADTRIMTIVHNALRRDIDRAQLALNEWPYPDPVQRVAIAEHLAWMMWFLHLHHDAEDQGLYPIVRQRVPDAATVLEVMDADHQNLGAVMAQVETAAAEYAADERGRAALLAAVNELAAVMLPHLQREEDKAMPIVSACMSAAEWNSWDREYNFNKRSKAELVISGLWLMDGASEDDDQVVRSLAPKLAWFAENFLQRRYDRQAYRRWYLPRHNRNRRQQVAGLVDVDIAAAPETVWGILADPTLVPEWSHECRDIELLDPKPVVTGSRFRGGNRVGRSRWSRVCTVFRAQAPMEFAYLTSGGPGDSTAWHFRLEPTSTGTRLTQAYRVASMPRWLSIMVSIVIPNHADRTHALREDLLRLGAIAEGVASGHGRTQGPVASRLDHSDEIAGQVAHRHTTNAVGRDPD